MSVPNLDFHGIQDLGNKSSIRALRQAENFIIIHRMQITLLKKIFENFSLICIFCLITLSCSNRDNFEELKANIVAPDQDHIEIIEGEKLYFIAEVSGGVPPYKYSWDFSAVAPSSSEKNPGEIVFNWHGAYKVLLTVKDTKSNIKTDFLRIIVEKDKYSVQSQRAF